MCSDLRIEEDFNKNKICSRGIQYSLFGGPSIALLIGHAILFYVQNTVVILLNKSEFY